MSRQFFEDMEPGRPVASGPFHVDGSEMLEFNRKWDTLPIHIDDKAARLMGHKGIIASGQYTLCIKQYFVNRSDWHGSVIGTAGWDEVRFPTPVYAGDKISARIRCIEKRASRSKPDRGIVKFEIILVNQDDDIVLSFIDTVMMEKRLKE